ncbi:MAG TPA: hypothetical protein V6C81_27185 [Planktothrix sp.]|jgi:hypothetical protein
MIRHSFAVPEVRFISVAAWLKVSEYERFATFASVLSLSQNAHIARPLDNRGGVNRSILLENRLWSLLLALQAVLDYLKCVYIISSFQPYG